MTDHRNNGCDIVYGHFGTKTLRHYNLVPKCPGAEVSRDRVRCDIGGPDVDGSSGWTMTDVAIMTMMDYKQQEWTITDHN